VIVCEGEKSADAAGRIFPDYVAVTSSGGATWRSPTLVALWYDEAKKHGVFPLDDRRYERVDDPTRPVAAIDKPSYDYYPGTSVVHPLAAPHLLGHDHTITAYVMIPDGGAEGVLACAGTEFGGWSLFMKDGKLQYAHNYLKMHEYEVASDRPVPSGLHRLSMHFTPKQTSERPAFSIGDVALFIDDQPVGELKDIKMAGQYSAVTGYGLLIGRNTGMPVSSAYETPFAFTGALKKVTIAVDGVPDNKVISRPKFSPNEGD